MTTKSQAPILIALGANLPSRAGGPRDTLEAAIGDLTIAGVLTRQRSRWFSSPAWPASDQPPYVNGVIAVETTLDPAALLALLHRVEAGYGRVRGLANAARPLDLDLLAYGDRIEAPAPGQGPILPHPRLAQRAFVLLPLAEVAPGWRHPVTGHPIDALIDALVQAEGDPGETVPLE
jgi:2-amino-4-hydroxy-6-hydroxymethyldihydropteridine diphosphokinase